MPDTITAYNTFSPNTKARATEVNTNFSNHRGTLVPINANTASASDLTHDLGSADHKWRKLYVQDITYDGSTSTTFTATGMKRSGLQQNITATSGFNQTITTGGLTTTSLQVTITTSGGRVFVGLQNRFASYAAGHGIEVVGNNALYFILQFIRDTTTSVVTEFDWRLQVATSSTHIIPPGQFWYVDNPGAGTYTYKVRIDKDVAATEIEFKNVGMIAYEL